MLSIHIPKTRLFNPQDNTFLYVDETDLQLEHSLMSVAKWEAKWHKPFLSDKKKTREETLDYIRCMIIGKNVNPLAVYAIENKDIERINEYINDPMTATTFNRKGQKKSRKVITSEVIYYWMTALQIPFECQKWHLNRLLTLVEVCNEEQAPKKKMKAKDVARQNASLNAARRAAYNSKG